MFLLISQGSPASTELSWTDSDKRNIRGRAYAQQEVGCPLTDYREHTRGARFIRCGHRFSRNDIRHYFDTKSSESHSGSIGSDEHEYGTRSF